MDLPTALTHHIHQLLDGLGIDDAALVEPLNALHRALGAGVESFRGFQLVIVDHGHRVVLTWFVPDATPDDLRTSLRLPLTALLPARTIIRSTPPGAKPPDPLSRIVLYAATPGAFVDLAADITYALHLPPPRTAPTRDGHTDVLPLSPSAQSDSRADGQVGIPADGAHDEQVEDVPWTGITLDQGTIPTAVERALTGVAERSAINQAVGVLLARGFDIESAFDELRRRAERAGQSIAHQAREVLEQAVHQRHSPEPDGQAVNSPSG